MSALVSIKGTVSSEADIQKEYKAVLDKPFEGQNTGCQSSHHITLSKAALALSISNIDQNFSLDSPRSIRNEIFTHFDCFGFCGSGSRASGRKVGERYNFMSLFSKSYQLILSSGYSFSCCLR